MNQTRMLGRLRRRARHELKVRRYTNGWTSSRETGKGQGRCGGCGQTEGARTWKRIEEREWRRKLLLDDE